MSDRKDDKVTNLENDAQERIRRIGSLRAQIVRLASEEKEIRLEYDETEIRRTSLRKRRDELARMKEEEAALNKDVRQREEKQSELIAELERLREIRGRLIPEVARLRANLSNEESGVKNDLEESARLEKALAEKVARKKKIIEDTEFFRQAEEELSQLEEQYKQIAERIPLTRKKYEQTKQIVEAMGKNIDPISRSIMDIWQQLPPDVLDKKLVVLLPKK